MFADINFWAVVAAAVASMAVGFVWYGPLFGKIFMRVNGFDRMTPEQQAQMKKGMAMTYVWQLVASLVMFYIFAAVVGSLGQLTFAGGLMTGFWVWLGFIVPVQLGQQLWGGKMTLFWLGAGNMLLTMLAAGAIIGAWH